MKQRRRSLILTLVVVLGVALLWLSLRPREPDLGAGPTFNGKTVTAWIDSIWSANSEDPAITNLIAIGSPAVPYLIRAVEWNPSGLDRLGGVAWRHTGWLARRLDLPHPEVTRSRENRKRRVMYVLACLGPLAKDALPALREVGRDSDWNNRTFAFSAIASIGPEEKDIPLLVRALADTNRAVRFQGARGLGNLGFPSKEAIGALNDVLHDEAEAVRKQVSAALMKIDPDAAANVDRK